MLKRIESQPILLIKGYSTVQIKVIATTNSGTFSLKRHPKVAEKRGDQLDKCYQRKLLNQTS